MARAFLQTVLWTALNYNPVRILGGIGLGLIALASLIAAALDRYAYRWDHPAWRMGGSGRLRRSSSGTHREPTSLHSGPHSTTWCRSFTNARFARGSLGNRSFVCHSTVSSGGWDCSACWPGWSWRWFRLVLGLSGWPIERLWLYFLAATMLLLLGAQLALFWVIMRVLEELSQRDALAQADVVGRTQ